MRATNRRSLAHWAAALTLVPAAAHAAHARPQPFQTTFAAAPVAPRDGGGGGGGVADYHNCGLQRGGAPVAETYAANAYFPFACATGGPNGAGFYVGSGAAAALLAGGVSGVAAPVVVGFGVVVWNWL